MHVRSMLVSLAHCPGHCVEVANRDRQGHCGAEGAAHRVAASMKNFQLACACVIENAMNATASVAVAFTCFPTRFFAILDSGASTR